VGLLFAFVIFFLLLVLVVAFFFALAMFSTVHHSFVCFASELHLLIVRIG